MSASAAARAYPLDPLRDVRHREARAARDCADWLAWLQVSNAAPRTLDAYERTVAALLRCFPDKQFDEFTDGDLLQLLTTYPAKSRHQNKSHLANFFRWGYRQRRIPSNPVDLLPSIKYKPTRAYDVFSDAEVDALCSLPTPDGALMSLLFWCGIRRAEARMLTVKRLNFDARIVVLIDGVKGAKDRKVPMLEPVQVALSELVLLEGLEREDHLWYDQPGDARSPVRRSKPVGNTSFQHWWDRSVAAAGVRRRNPHMARHTFATKMRAIGLPMEEIQQLLGHESIRTTVDTYIHSNVDTIGDHMRELMEAR